MSKKRYAEVAVALPLREKFLYRIPDGLASKAKLGCRLKVPFRNRYVVGFLVGFAESRGKRKLKDVQEILDSSPIISPQDLRLAGWIAQRYFCSLGEAIEAMLPVNLRKL
jgi:primosomal protein N' (replication factor Y)